jgi:hypothetical protein
MNKNYSQGSVDNDNVMMLEEFAWWNNAKYIIGNDISDVWKNRKEKLSSINIDNIDIENIVAIEDDYLIHKLLQDIFLEPIYTNDVKKIKQIVSDNKINRFRKYYKDYRGYRCSAILKMI